MRRSSSSSHLLVGLARLWRLWRRRVRDVRFSPALRLYALALLIAYAFLAVTFARSGGAGAAVERLPPWLLSPQPPDALPDAASLRHLWRSRRFFFVASPGRAGSKYLAAVVGAARSMIALHEPPPQMTGDVLRASLLEGHVGETFSARSADKLAAIHRTLAGTAHDVGYAEASHMCVKTFADVVLRRVAPAARNVTIVVLQRDVADVVWSQLQLGWMREAHAGRDVWYYDAADIHAAARVLGDGLPPVRPEKQSQVDRLFWYNADVAARTRAMIAEVRAEQRAGRLFNVDVVPFRLAREDERDAVAEAARFLEKLGLTPDLGRLSVLQRQDANARDSKKGRVSISDRREDVTQVVRELAASLIVGGTKLYTDGFINLDGLC